MPISRHLAAAAVATTCAAAGLAPNALARTTHYTGTQWVDTGNVDFSGTPSVNFYDLASIPGSSDVWAVGQISSGGQTNTMIADYPALP